LLGFELSEIEAASPSEPEEEQLEAEGRRLESAEALRLAAAAASRAIEPATDDAQGSAAADMLAAAAAGLQSVEGRDASLDQLAERCNGLLLEARELAGELQQHAAALESDPERLDALRERLDLLARLKRKYGGSIAAVLDHARRCERERERLSDAAGRGEESEQRLAELEATLERLAGELTGERTRRAPELERAVRSELETLALQDASFEVRLLPVEDSLSPRGAETAEFMIAPNPGVAAGPLREIASGGELSRVMLALMTIASSSSGAPTIIFDEVDAGIGGKTARVLGAKLRELGRSRQVLCITHLPQVASLASGHFQVTKTTEAAASARGALARACVSRIAGDEVVEELCRMLGSTPGDDSARRHAERLLKAA
jgi:DNA repair protein RecN (Recombination protein N)